MRKYGIFIKDQSGYAVVEATILFPIMMMIFAGLVLLAIYLPTRSVLQQATQYAATALATEQSDTWLIFDEGQMQYTRANSRRELPNVYVALFSSVFSGAPSEKARIIVEKMEENSIVSRNGTLTVSCVVNNYVIYKEIIVTATRTLKMPVDLSFVGFPSEIPITVSSSSVVQNGDEFVRTVDLASQFIAYLDEKYDIKDFISGFSDFLSNAASFLGI